VKAAESAELFNGKDLTGWRMMGDASRSQWKVGTAKLDPATRPKIGLHARGNELFNVMATGEYLYRANFGDAVI